MWTHYKKQAIIWAKLNFILLTLEKEKAL